MAQLTDAGYKLKTQNEWFADEIALYLEIDPDWDLDPSTPDGLKAAHDAEILSALDESLLAAYNSKDPDKARGIDLDAISAFAGVIRRSGTRSDVTLRYFGNVGALVLVGAIAESEDTGQRWITEQSYTILPSGFVDVQAFAQEVGAVSADTATVTKIATVMSGITAVTNQAPARLGLDPQSDASLRLERRRQVGKPSNNQLDSMYAEIMATEDVRRVAIYNNNSGSAAVSDVNPHGLPAHSMAVIVDGGADDDVAMSMYMKLNPGPTMHQAGTPVAVTVVSPVRPSNEQVVKFSRPVGVPMTLAVTVVGDGLPDDVQQQVRDAVMDYAVGSLLDPSVGFRSTGFNIGEAVPYSSMFTPVNKIIGQYGNSFVSQILLNGGTANVPVAFNRLSEWAESRITVTVAP